MRDCQNAFATVARVRVERHAYRWQGWILDSQDEPAIDCTSERKDSFSANAYPGTPHQMEHQRVNDEL